MPSSFGTDEAIGFPGTIVEALARHARSQPDAKAVTFLIDGEEDPRV